MLCLEEGYLMSRIRQDPLRSLNAAEKHELIHVSQSLIDEASRVAHAKELLAVAEGKTYAEAARAAGRRAYHAVSALVSRFNKVGLAALNPGHGGGRQPNYGDKEKQRIVDELKRQPDRKDDGTAVWSIETLKKSLRRADDGLPDVGHRTIWETLHDAGYSWQKDRSWCTTGIVLRKRKDGIVEVTDIDKDAKKKLSKKPTHRGKGSASTSGAKTKPAPSRPSRSKGKSGVPSDTPNAVTTNTSAKARRSF
jgi:transposase